MSSWIPTGNQKKVTKKAPPIAKTVDPKPKKSKKAKQQLKGKTTKGTSVQEY